MTIKPVYIQNPKNRSHFKPEWVVKVGFKRVWDGYGENGEDVGTGDKYRSQPPPIGPVFF